MHQIILSSDDYKSISELRHSHPNLIVRRRLTVLYFKYLRMQHGAIAKLAEIKESSVSEIIKLYLSKGLERIMHVTRSSNNMGELDGYKDMLKEHFLKFPPATVAHAKEEIFRITGIERSITRVKSFLHKIGLKPRKTMAIPAKADPEKQEEFKKKLWIPK